MLCNHLDVVFRQEATNVQLNQHITYNSTQQQQTTHVTYRTTLGMKTTPLHITRSLKNLHQPPKLGIIQYNTPIIRSHTQ